MTAKGVPTNSLRKLTHYRDTLSLLFTSGAPPNSMLFYGALADFAATVGGTPLLSLTCSYRATLMNPLRILLVDDVVAVDRGLPGGTPQLRRRETN